MEIYFYLWIALIALLPQRHQVKAIVCAMLLLIAWGVGCLIFDTASVFNGQQPLRYLLTGLGLEFLAGALVAHAHASGSRIFKSPTLTIPICIVLMAAGVSLGMTSSYFDRVEIMRAASFGVMGAAALVLALTLEQTPLTPPAWLVRVGDASYSLYLLHTFLLDASGRMRVWLQIDNPTVLLFFMLALPVAIVLLSMVWYRRVERPIMEASFRGKSLALPKKTRCESPG
jgi:peptidoglycan/LPS O-acetylase OafA/YrhL